MRCTPLINLLFSICVIVLLIGCSRNSENTLAATYPAVTAAFGAAIDPSNLPNYANQTRPGYIVKDNTNGNNITNAKATLGRVLFYDKNLSTNNTVSCGSCHKQALAFGDNVQASIGANGNTDRHAMRLVNARFATELKFFWDERAASLEVQTTQPIQNHAEMGFSGLNGAPGLSTLLTKLQGIGYYNELFTMAYGNATVTESRMQECLSQFVRSIQSFDSKYDAGRALAANDNATFANFTAQENLGKQLFLTEAQFNANGERISGGANCNICHRAPEFDIDPSSRNNGTIGTIAGGRDVTVTRAPSLRDVVKADGSANGPFMHNGASFNLVTVTEHYNQINLAGNTNLDPRLAPGGMGQKLLLTQAEKDALVAFIRTLAGSNVYTDAKWSNPFPN